MKNTKTFYNTEIPEGWHVKKVKEILLEGRLGGNYENAEANTGIPVIKMGNLDRGNIKIDKVQYLPQNETYEIEDVLEHVREFERGEPGRIFGATKLRRYDKTVQRTDRLPMGCNIAIF